MGRAPCCDKGSVKKGPWSPEEDRKLKDYIHTHGTGGNWIALPTKAGMSITPRLAISICISDFCTCIACTSTDVVEMIQA